MRDAGEAHERPFIRRSLNATGTFARLAGEGRGVTSPAGGRSDQLALRKVPHQLRCSELPGFAAIRVADAVDEAAELRGRDGDDVAELVGEALAGRVTILDGREQGAEEEHRPIGEAMMRIDELAHEIGGIAADLGDRGHAVERKAIL